MERICKRTSSTTFPRKRIIVRTIASLGHGGTPLRTTTDPRVIEHRGCHVLQLSICRYASILGTSVPNDARAPHDPKTPKSGAGSRTPS